MRGYIITIVGATLLATFSDLLVPGSWKKYIRITTGVILIMTILTPIFKLKNISPFEEFAPDQEIVEQGMFSVGDQIARELETRVAEDATERIRQEFHAEAIVTVTVKTNAENKIEKISSMYVTGKDLPSGIKDRLLEIYDADEVVVDG